MCVFKITFVYFSISIITTFFLSASNNVHAHTTDDTSNNHTPDLTSPQLAQDIDWYKEASICLESMWKDSDIPITKPYAICYGNDKLGVSKHVDMMHTIDDRYPKDQIPNREEFRDVRYKIQLPHCIYNSSGPHRQAWGVYGEYKYLPPGRFVHNLEHGGAAFLYHPCTPKDIVDMLRQLATGCTWQHVMSAYPKILNKTYPMAIVTYGCEYRMSDINLTDIQEWMKAIRVSPEAKEFRQGSYNHSLIHASKIPDQPKDESETPFCANIEHIQHRKYVKSTSSPTDTSSSDIAPNPSSNKSGSSSKTPRTSEAYWAVGSLAFLLSGLVAAVCYTQLWRKGNQGESFEKSRVWNDENTPGSVSVAAIVRKFPHMLKNKMKNTNILKTSQKNRYHRIVIDDETCSEEEL